MFWIVIADGSTKYGEIRSASYWESTDALNQAGSFRFAMPAADPKAALVLPARTATCYTIVNGALVEAGSGIIDDVNLAVSNGAYTGMIEVAGNNLLRELAYRYVGDMMIDDSGSPESSGPADIIAYAPSGWTLDTEFGYTSTAKAIRHTYAGESVLGALIRLADITGERFRLGPDRTVVWLRNDVDSSGVRAFLTADPNRIGDNPVGCLITQIERRQDSFDAYVGRVYAFGAGNGDAKITMSGATVPGGYTGYTLSSDARGYYLEHTATWSAYGRESWQNWNDIDDSQTLLEAAYEFLRKSSTPNVTYSMELAGLKNTILPGQTIYVDARRWVDRYAAVGITENLHVVTVTNRLDGSGFRTVQLDASTSATFSVNDADVVADNIMQIKAAIQHAQPTGVEAGGFPIRPASITDSSAPNNSIYYSTTASKLVYKNSAGTINNLY